MLTNQSVDRKAFLALLIVMVFASCFTPITNSQTESFTDVTPKLTTSSSAQTSQTLTSFGTVLTNSPPPSQSQMINGIWFQSATPADFEILASRNFKYVYLMAGYWRSDGSIGLYLSTNQIYGAVTNAHSAGLKIMPWIISGPDDGARPPADIGEVINVSPYMESTNIASIVSLVQVYGFDGFADDVEDMSPWSFTNLVNHFNSAKNALSTLHKEYFTTLIVDWVSMGDNLFESIHVDRLQAMCYGGHTLTEYKVFMNYFLSHSNSPVGLAIHSDSGSYPTKPLKSSIAAVNEQLLASPTNMFAGIDIFWLEGMTQAQWIFWNF